MPEQIFFFYPSFQVSPFRFKMAAAINAMRAMFTRLGFLDPGPTMLTQD